MEIEARCEEILTNAVKEGRSLFEGLALAFIGASDALRDVGIAGREAGERMREWAIKRLKDSSV